MKNNRILAIDALRGLVIVLMLVDHVRDMFYLQHQVTDPMDVTTTDPALFFTRLLSHLCAPIFVFLTGLGTWLYAQKRALSPHATRAYLIKRGLLLILLELTLINFAWTFTLPPTVLYLQVIWAIGVSMLALAALISLSWKHQLTIALTIILGHNLLGGIQFTPNEIGYIPWGILHDRSMIDIGGFIKARTSYPVLPWIGVMTLGYVAGQLYHTSITAAPMAALKRQKRLVSSGLIALTLFFIMRTSNLYGDTQPWLHTPSLLINVMSFFNLTKYPPSALFLLFTLGIGVLLLALMERYPAKWQQPLALLGSVPLFFYITHLYALGLLRQISTAIFGAHPATGHFQLSQVTQLWMLSLGLLLLLYFLCLAFVRYRRR